MCIKDIDKKDIRIKNDKYSFHYRVAELPEQWKVKENDGDEIKILNFKFMTIDEIKDIDLKPTSIKKILIERQYNNFNHIINRK